MPSAVANEDRPDSRYTCMATGPAFGSLKVCVVVEREYCPLPGSCVCSCVWREVPSQLCWVIFVNLMQTGVTGEEGTSGENVSLRLACGPECHGTFLINN